MCLPKQENATSVRPSYFKYVSMAIYKELRCGQLITQEKDIFQWGPLSTGFHDVICIVLLLCYLSYFLRPSLLVIIAFNKAWMTFILEMISKRRNWNKYWKPCRVSKNHSIILSCNVHNFAFGILKR